MADSHAHHDPLDPDHLMAHVQDSTYFEVPKVLTPDGSGKLHIPQLFHKEGQKPLWQYESPNDPVSQTAIRAYVKPLDLKLTKFMVLEVVAALLVCMLFIWLAAKVRSGARPIGKLWNLLETFVVFIRDEVARPAIGHHDGDKFLPFLLTLFFFILGCNLLGMLPWLGSPTGAIGTTLALAGIVFLVTVGAGMKKMGFLGFFKSLVPHMGLPLALAIPLIPLIFFLELVGLLIKHVVLAVRLVANMMAGHLVLAVIIAFIAAAWSSLLIYAVAPASILGSVALSMLELFVAFLQAYIFTFLAALFIGTAVHPH